MIAHKGSDKMKSYNLTRMSKFLFMFFAGLALTACNPIEYKDISAEKRFNSLLGIEFQSLVPVIATGITIDPNYKPVVSSVLLVPKPGFSGPGTVFRKELPKGVIIKVVGVFSEGRMFFNQLFYKVRILDFAEYKNFPIFIYVSGDINTPNRGVDDKVFKLRTNY